MNIKRAIKKITKEMRKDKTEGSYYYSWQANIACSIMDNTKATHKEANKAAKAFLNTLIR